MSKPRQYIPVVDETGCLWMIKLSEIDDIADCEGFARIVLRGGLTIDVGESAALLQARREQADLDHLPTETATSKRTMKSFRLALEAMEEDDHRPNCLCQ